MLSCFRTGRKVSHKLVDLTLHPHYHKWNYFQHRCNVCGRRTVFVCDDARERWIRKCVWCRSTPKYRAIVWVLEERLGCSLPSFLDDRSRQLYELTTTSPIYRCHRHRRNYVCSGYFSDRPFKTQVRSGVWNEDLQNLHFVDGSFDLVVSSETMEHVRRPWVGFQEIARVLKPGGFHCFTIPYSPVRTTTARVDTSGPDNIYILPKVYHQDPYCPEDSLVYTDFGRDLPQLLEPFGFRTREYLVQDRVSDIHDDLRPMRVFLSEKVTR